MQVVVTEADRQALEAGFYVDESYGNYVCDFIESTCIFSTGEHAGKPFILLPWQREFIHRLYSWRTPEGLRRHRIASLWVPRKNGKTELAAALTIYHALADGEANPNIYFAASSVDQARIAYRATSQFILNNEALSNHLWLRDHVRQIDLRRSPTYPAGGLVKVLSGTGKSKQGLNASLVVADEVAEWQHRELYDALRLSQGSRKEPILLTISTAGYNRSGIGYEGYRYAKSIIDGEITDDFAFLPVIYEADEQADWQDPATAIKANPSYGETIRKEFFSQLLTEAKNEPLKENSYRTFHLNQWVGSAKSWLPSAWWTACGDNFKQDDFRHAEAIIGLDLSMRHDLTAYTVIVENSGFYYLFPRFFIPEDMADLKERKDRVPYRAWSKKPENYLTFCTGDKIHQNQVKESIEADLEHFGVKEMRYDPNGASLLAEALDTSCDAEIVEVRPTRPSMTPATVEFYNLLREGKIRHPNNDVLNWNSQNCVAREDNFGRVLVEKGRCLQRVDGIIATIIALTFWTNYRDDDLTLSAWRA